jgi:nucleoside-diphosphate-sugar epimerase
VHIEDITRAFLAVLAAPREAVNGQALNVGRDDQNYRISEIAQIVKETVPGCEIAFAEGAGPDKRNYRADFGKIARVLPAFQPQWDARKGARQLYEAYKDIGLKLEDFEGPRYRRIDQLRNLMHEGYLGEDLRWQTAVPAA